MDSFGLGIIGCGNISSTYLKNAPLFKALEVRAVADTDMRAARARSAEYGVRAETVERLLASEDIQLGINLTLPNAHFEVTKSILLAGKHAYSEKPLALTLEDSGKLQRIAKETGLRVGSAPDTWMGGAHQIVRSVIDGGEIGSIIAGTAHLMNHGMEHWHPAPESFYLPGAGPMLDIGPYYVTNLVQLLGPVERVAALTSSATHTRTITAAGRNGEQFPVNTPTNIHSLLHFRSGATIALSTSWDVWSHRHAHTELYGSEGSIFVPDPNFFGGTTEIVDRNGKLKMLESSRHPFGIPNHKLDTDGLANYRAAGVAEMVQAILGGQPHRCSLELALHVTEVMTGILKSGETGEFVAMATVCDRPAPISDETAGHLLC